MWRRMNPHLFLNLAVSCADGVPERWEQAIGSAFVTPFDTRSVLLPDISAAACLFTKMQGNHQASAKLSESIPTRDHAVFFEPRPTEPPCWRALVVSTYERSTIDDHGSKKMRRVSLIICLLRLGSFQRRRRD